MANSYLIKEASLVDIANKIRNLTNSENKLTIADISSAIDNEKQNLDAAIAVLVERGIEVPEGATSADLAGLIDLIEGSSASAFPEFTYSGTYELIDDGLAADGKTQNWRVKFLTSGVLTFSKLGSGEKGISFFCVGGGGGGGCYKGLTGHGGGGGYIKSGNAYPLLDTAYQIVVGAGGSGAATGEEGNNGSDGGTTIAFDVSANGGKGATIYKGGDGASGGGAGANLEHVSAGAGGSNGANGGTAYNFSPGTGSGITTREFGDSDGELYSGGGGGENGYAYGDGVIAHAAGGAGGGGSGGGENGKTNTGGGGGGGRGSGNYPIAAGHGGSGIVIIRNIR